MKNLIIMEMSKIGGHLNIYIVLSIVVVILKLVWIV